MTVTVIIPTRDRWDWLERSLGSALAQVGVDIEVIVVDDASTTDRPTYFAALDDRVRWLRHDENVGVSAARNSAIEAARGEWVAFLDDDDLWAEDHLATLLATCRDANARFAYSASWVVDAVGRVKSLRPAPDPSTLQRVMLETNAIGTPSALIMSRALCQDSGGFDEDLSPLADWDLWLRISRTSAGCASNTPTLAYTEHPANMSLDIPRVLAEFAVLEQRYAPEATAHGVRFGSGEFAAWIARNYRRSGQRRKASRWYFRSALDGRRPRDLLKGAGVILGEPFMRRFAASTPGGHAGHPSWLLAAGAFGGHLDAPKRNAGQKSDPPSHPSDPPSHPGDASVP